MQSRVLIKTPKGYATSTERKLRPFIIGKRKNQSHEIYVSKDDDQILWIIEADIKNHFKISRNVLLYDKMVSQLLNNKLIRKAAKLTKEQRQELDSMLFKHTKILLVSDDETKEMQKKFKKIDI